MNSAIRPFVRAIAVAILGAMAGALCLTVAFSREPGVTLELDRDLPQILSGVYPPEYVQDLTFAWTAGRAQLTLKGLDRRVPWVCTVRFRGGRGAPPQPVVDLSIDGITAASRVATNEYEDLEVTAPPRDRPGLVLSIAVSSTVIPGPQDPRELGVQLDRLACRPSGAGVALPPRRALFHAMVTAAVLGAALALITVTAAAAVGATLLLAAAQAVPFSAGPAPYAMYGDLAVRLALWIAVAMVASVMIAQRWTKQRLRNTARFVIAFSAAVLYLKLLALLHPSKMLADAVFQAHRLEWVLSGRFFFTQLMPGGVQFPYAIGLYVFAAPWSILTRDYVMLLRVVVCTSEVIAGALLYGMVVRVWGDRLSGAVAAALFSVVPMSYWFIGHANLTNVFAQTAALVMLVALTTLSLRPGQFGHIAALTALASLAFLSHVSTFAILLVILGVVLSCYWWLGGAPLRGPARSALLATTLATVFSVVVYYGHFGEVYKNALRVRAQTAATATSDQSKPTTGSDALGAPRKYRTFTPLHVRTRDALVLSVQSVGWPILLLAAIGAWRVWVRRACDRLVLALAGWTLAYAIFLAVGLMRVDVQYQRYSYEFVGRVAFATYPAAVILAAYGAAWAWRVGHTARIASAVLLLSALILGVQNWLQWLR